VTALQHVSLFSGVGGIDLAMHRAGIQTVAAVEIDRAARGVLADQFPLVNLFTDVREVTGDKLRRLGLKPRNTIVSAGFPCQDLSVAGRRRGMGEGTRSGLYWEVDRILADFAPAWVVLENVPGLLSASCACPGDGTCVERALAVRCDGETHGVPGGACWGQCIPRHGGVMGAVVGSLGERGYGFAYRVLDARHFGVPQRRRRVVIVGRLGDDGRAPARVLLEPEGVRGNPAQGITPRTLTAARAGGSTASSRVTSALTTRSTTALDDQGIAQLVVGVLGQHSHALTAEGHDASEDGAGRGTPIVTVAFDPKAGGDRTSSGAFEVGTGITPTLSGARSPAVLYAADIANALDTAQGGPDDNNSAQGGHLVAFAENQRGELVESATVGALAQGGGKPGQGYPAVHDGTIVRRLTPLECERLQGFPDGHTDTSWGRPQADSPRGKQMGNAVAVPVFEWVARRIDAVHRHLLTAKDVA